MLTILSPPTVAKAVEETFSEPEEADSPSARDSDVTDIADAFCYMSLKAKMRDSYEQFLKDIKHLPTKY